MSIKRNEVIQHIADLITESLLDFNIKGSAASEIGLTTADMLSSRFGGQIFSMPHDGSAFFDDESSGRNKSYRMRERRNGLLKAISATVTDEVKKLSDESLNVDDIADATIKAFCFVFADTNLTIPKDKRFKIYQRDQRIIKEFNGINHEYLSEKYDISVNALYRIMKKY